MKTENMAVRVRRAQGFDAMGEKGESIMVRRRTVFHWLGVGAIGFAPLAVMAQWDGGTNAIDSVENTVVYATTVGTPVMLGLIGLFMGVGLIILFVKRGRRA